MSRKELFLGFLKIGLLGFGGVATWARHVIVEERAWLSEREYASVIGVGQVLPGANTVNAAVLIGDRFQGVPGAVAAVAGLLAMPLLILVALATLYERWASLPDVQAAMGGAAAAAAGMVIGTALKMGWRLRPTPPALLVGAVAFLAVAVLHMPLFHVVLILGPLGIGAAYLEGRS